MCSSPPTTHSSLTRIDASSVEGFIKQFNSNLIFFAEHAHQCGLIFIRV
jgi:hypothetical protein